MATKYYEGLGGLWLPERTKSYRSGIAVPERVGIVVARQQRPRWSIEGLVKFPKDATPERIRALVTEALAEMDPAKLQRETIWASVSANDRVDDGAGIQFSRVLGTVGAANGVAVNVAVATTGFTVETKTDRSIGVIGQGATTNEFTTIGLSRAAGAVGNYVAPASLNGTASADVSKTFTLSGSGTAHGAALFDQLVVAGSLMYVEHAFSSDAVLVSADTLLVTWTITM